MAKVRLHRTAAEWRVIRARMNKKSFNTFMRCEAQKIVAKYEECPFCVTPAEGDKVEKVFQLEPEVYSIFEEIALKMKKPIASVIDDFIIVPLLRP